MRTAKLHLVPLISMLLIACGDVATDDRIYGTWVEPLNGAIIEFRTDGSMSWEGEEGTFEFVRSSNWAVCGGRSGCADGDLSIDLPSQSFRTSYYSNQLDAEPNRFYILPRNFSGLVTTVNIYGQDVEGFNIHRQGSFTGGLMPESYTRIDSGLPVDGDLRNYLMKAAVLAGEVVAEVNSSLARFDQASQGWQQIDPAPQLFAWNHTSDALYTDGRVSFDAGRSWTTLPMVNDTPGLSDHQSLGKLLVGNTAIEVMSEYEGMTPGVIETWALDLSAPSAGWTKQGELPAASASTVSADFASLGILVLTKYNDMGETYQISHDLGVSWTDFESRCFGGNMAAHSGGIYCSNRDETLSWFDLATQSWSDYDVGFTVDYQSVPNVAQPINAAYLISGEQLIAWSPEGTESVAALSTNITGWNGGVFVFDEQVIVSKLTIWRTER
ncbi:MAG: hypothetical protein VX834_06640 [Myxococcota bacterium]|nr:hypothetical protein [Myxococcota bacterium]